MGGGEGGEGGDEGNGGGAGGDCGGHGGGGGASGGLVGGGASSGGGLAGGASVSETVRKTGSHRGGQAAPWAAGRGRAALAHGMRRDDVEIVLDGCVSRVATNISTVHVGEPDSGNRTLGEQISFRPRARHAWREDGADSGGAEEGAEEAPGRLCLWCHIGRAWAYRGEGRSCHGRCVA